MSSPADTIREALTFPNPERGASGNADALAALDVLVREAAAQQDENDRLKDRLATALGLDRVEFDEIEEAGGGTDVKPTTGLMLPRADGGGKP